MAIRRSHPAWCESENECGTTALHLSGLWSVAPRGDEVIQVRAGLWRMDVGPAGAEGVAVELSVGEDVEWWPIDLAQARALVRVLNDLLRNADRASSRAA